MLSTEMPVHHLAKTGPQEIRIIRRPRGGGQVNLYWKVDPNPAVGHPGPLAYRLDTWVIKRCLDHLHRPIPRLVRIGDLRQIARDLGCGGDTNAVKRAFEQNASAFIRAKVAYADADGRETSFEGYFNRYNVFFRGQALPGGTRAETVYISLNDPYHGLMNASVWRPLDYQYLRTLTPTAQRWYELVSPKMFAAIKNRRPMAWFRYSDFCALSATKPQKTKQRMQSQMAVIHRAHLASGYLSSVLWRTERSEDGTADWTIHYVPGARAKAEFAAFNGPRQRPPENPESRVRSSTWNRHHRSDNPSERQEGPATDSIVRRFQQRRHGLAIETVTPTQRARAAELLAAVESDLPTALMAVDLAADHAKRTASGYPNHIGGVLEGGFVERARANREAQRRGALTDDLHRRSEAARREYESWCQRRAEERIASLSAESKRRLVDDGLPRVLADFEFYLRQRRWSDARVRDWAEPRILARYAHEGEPSFEAWRRAHEREATGTSGPTEALQ